MEARLSSSSTLKNVMEKTGITSVEALIYADLRSVGWEKSDAFYAAFHHVYSGYRMTDQKKMMNTLEADKSIKARINRTADTEEVISAKDLAKETSKEKILSDLVVARRRMREGTKEWAETTKMIADYAKIKQDEIKTDEQPIRYFLPVNYPRSCADCLISQNEKKKKKK